MNALSTVQFHEQSITVLNHNEKPYVAMRSIVENIGLDWEAQRQRIARHPVLSATACMIKAVAQDGKSREVLALPLSVLNGWLFGVDSNRVRPEIRDTLIQYQTECFDVLFNHFMPKVAAQQTQLATAAQKQHLKSLVSDRVSKTGLHFQKVWTAVQEANGFNRLDNLTPQSYAKSCAYFKADPIGLNPDDWAHAPVALPQSQPATFKVPDGMMLIPRTAALNLWNMAKQLTSGIDALGMIDGDMPKWLVA